MNTDTRSDHDPGRRLEEALLAVMESIEKGEAPDLREEYRGDPEVRAALEEWLQDEKVMESWFAPLLAVTPGVGRFFGNYELLKFVGEGSQGVVWRGREIHINKEVALKIVNPGDRRRSLRELELAANLEHEHLVRVYHVGEYEGLLYFTMKLAEKDSLKDHLDEYRLQPVEAAATPAAVEERKKEIARFMAKVARAIHYMHEEGIIHRDIKPGNILLDAHGQPLVADLGLARRFKDTRGETPDTTPRTGGPEDEHTVGVVGAVGYMSPEQAAGRTDLTPATDIYGLGATLYKLLTGRTPFVGTREEIIAQTADPERLVPSPSVHNGNVGTGSDLGLICLQCLAKEPMSRYKTAAELADDLERYARGEWTTVRPPGPLEVVLRRTVEAINHTVKVPGVSRWGELDLWAGGLNLALGVGLYALIQTDQPPALLWLAVLAFEVLWWWVFLTYLFRRNPVEPVERDLGLLWAGVDLASLTLLLVYCPPFGPGRAADMLPFFPPLAVLSGLALLIVGRLYWGRYHLLGLAHFVVALLLPLCGNLAPLVYGLVAAVCMLCGAWDHFWTARRENPSAKENGRATTAS
jgi:serine/threonine protein kinase